MIPQFAAHGLVAGAVIAFIAFCFQAYLDPTVFVPVSSLLFLCR